MKKILTFITLLLISNPVFAAADCGLVSEITRPAAHIIMVIAPILLIHSKEDDLTSTKSAEIVYNNISSKDKELFPVNNLSTIVVTL